MKELISSATSHAASAIMTMTLVIASVLLFGITRIQRLPEQVIPDLALVYEVLLAFVTAMARHSIP